MDFGWTRVVGEGSGGVAGGGVVVCVETLGACRRPMHEADA